jgi:hypothetical protein
MEKLRQREMGWGKFEGRVSGKEAVIRDPGDGNGWKEAQKWILEFEGEVKLCR